MSHPIRFLGGVDLLFWDRRKQDVKGRNMDTISESLSDAASAWLSGFERALTESDCDAIAEFFTGQSLARPAGAYLGHHHLQRRGCNSGSALRQRRS